MGAFHKTRWSSDQVAELRRRFLAGESASIIGRGMGGLTRSQVMGKLSRLGLRAEDRPGKRLDMRYSKFWSPERDAELVSIYPTKTIAELSKHFDRKPANIQSRVALLRSQGVDIPDQRGLKQRRSRPLTGWRALKAARRAAEGKPPEPVEAKVWPAPVVFSANLVHIIDAKPGQCRWPLWPNGPRPAYEEMMVCGNPIAEQGSWCRSCRRLVYGTAEDPHDGRADQAPHQDLPELPPLDQEPAPRRDADQPAGPSLVPTLPAPGEPGGLPARTGDDRFVLAGRDRRGRVRRTHADDVDPV